MKQLFKISAIAFMSITSVVLSGCSDDDKEPKDRVTTTIGFQNAPSSLFANNEYGNNYYDGSVSTGFLTQIYGDTYAQFPLNYGYNYDASFNQAWCFTLYNGGFALSNYHNMTDPTYQNQMSVYNTSSPSGGNFLIATGNANVSDPSSATLDDYEGCARVYITDATGYSVKNVGQPGQLTGDDEEAWFESVAITNTTYTYLTMLNGDAFASPLNEENKGWFKVQFIAFDDDDANEKPLGYVDVYLANFDKNLAGGYTGIVDEWIDVDLSSLPKCSVLVINFLGSDMGQYGLNTPGYCALDNFKISVKK